MDVGSSSPTLSLTSSQSTKIESMGRMLEVHEASGIESRQAERRLRDALSSELHSQEEMAERRAAQARDARWMRGWWAGIRARGR